MSIRFVRFEPIITNREMCPVHILIDRAILLLDKVSHIKKIGEKNEERDENQFETWIIFVQINEWLHYVGSRFSFVSGVKLGRIDLLCIMSGCVWAVFDASKQTKLVLTETNGFIFLCLYIYTSSPMIFFFARFGSVRLVSYGPYIGFILWSNLSPLSIHLEKVKFGDRPNRKTKNWAHFGSATNWHVALSECVSNW